MKKLSEKRLETIHGGVSKRDCFALGVAYVFLTPVIQVVLFAQAISGNRTMYDACKDA